MSRKFTIEQIDEAMRVSGVGEGLRSYTRKELLDTKRPSEITISRAEFAAKWSKQAKLGSPLYLNIVEELFPDEVKQERLTLTYAELKNFCGMDDETAHMVWDGIKAFKEGK